MQIETLMRRLDWAWVVYASLRMRGFHVAASDVQLAAGLQPHDIPPTRCRKCGQLYTTVCIPCEYRNGGPIQEEEDERPYDMVDHVHRFEGARITDGFRMVHANL